MKGRILVGLAVLSLMIPGLVRAQNQQLPGFQLELPKLAPKYAPPEFVKRGLVVYYDCTGGVGDKSAGNFITVYLVDYVDEKWVAGQVLIINSFLNTMQPRTFCYPGTAGEFFVSPAMIRDQMIKPDPQCKVTAHTFIYEEGDNRIESIFNDAGLITGVRSIRGKTRGVMTFKAAHAVARPELPREFPNQARVNHVYMHSSVMMGRQVPMAKVTIEFDRLVDGVAHYKVNYNAVSGGMVMPSIPTAACGTTLQGPFYINPRSLSGIRPGMVTLDLPKARFRSTVTAVQQGMARIDHQIGGRTCAYTVYDLQTGLVKMHTENIAGAQLVLTLVQ
jgi:hypothetical protein